jgi:energy-coupling factor transport system ATP-binding protein
VVSLDRGRVAFDGSPSAFGDWAIAADPSLATPGMRLFSLAGIRPLPVSARDARATLRESGLESAVRGPRSAVRGSRAREKDRDIALAARDLWIELDSGEGVHEVLRGIEVEVAAGERVALMGRNGAGKSTLLRAAAGLLEPVRGLIATPAGCVLLPQSPTDLFVRERVAEELPGERGAAALDAVDLGWALERDPRDLSGGERERLALALVTAGRDESVGTVISLDEPTRGMDGARKAELASWLGELSGAGSAVVVATHDVEFASRFAERIVLLGDGELIADGPSDEILAGGWYFATEVARILGGEGAVTPEAGAVALRGALATSAGVPG